MKRLLAIAVTAFASLVLTSAASAQPPDTTTGTGKRPMFGATEQTHVNAKSYDGMNPRGHFHYRAAVPPETIDTRGDVTCHRVTGKAAVVGGPVDEPFTLGAFTIRAILFHITDGGSPGAGRDTVFPLFFETPTTPCPPPPLIGVFPITDGNFVVHDR